MYASQTTGPQRGVTRCSFSTPRGAEVCGPAFTPDGRTLFLAIQHPADEHGSTYDTPSTRWPDFRDGVVHQDFFREHMMTKGQELARACLSIIENLAAVA